MIKILLLLFICHWAADYTHLSRPYMLQAKRTGSPLLPILHHAGIHAVLQILILSFCQLSPEVVFAIAFIQLITHFIIDVLKGKMNVWFPSLSSPANPYHWYVFGADQFLHQLVIILCWAIFIA